MQSIWERQKRKVVEKEKKWSEGKFQVRRKSVGAQDGIFEGWLDFAIREKKGDLSSIFCLSCDVIKP